MGGVEAACSRAKRSSGRRMCSVGCWEEFMEDVVGVVMVCLRGGMVREDTWSSVVGREETEVGAGGGGSGGVAAPMAPPL